VGSGEEAEGGGQGGRKVAYLLTSRKLAKRHSKEGALEAMAR
jgi:hypothetical protein